ncbi:biopolymer transporter ExbD [Salipiger sp. PrR002]|uniref:biopolymer transporter ExbD n=1 Tax=Salipiger sp. PrR002 TaxID=2706489 RepID=UPI001F213BB6|nr:biopolymer transporter ExbD [Salipiger sp. PrR002]
MRKMRRRRKLSMTSLIDVIFLLLLFFMLTSTFTRFAEVELAAAGSGAAVSGETKPLFLQLGAEDLRLNGTVLTLEDLPAKLDETRGDIAEDAEPKPLIVALRGEVNSQRLTDLLVVLRGVSGYRAMVLGAS